MNIARSILIGVSCSLLPVLLFGLGLLISIHQTVGQPTAVKTALDESGIYSVAVTDLLKEAQKEDSGVHLETPQDIPTENARVQEAFAKAFPPNVLQEQGNGLIDGVYSWIKGDSASLQFEVNLSDAKEDLATNLSAYAQERAMTLPKCPLQSMPASLDPFNAECIPYGMPTDLVAIEAKRQVLTSEFFDDAIISADDFKNAQGQSLDQQLQAGPDVYAAITRGIFIAIGAVAILVPLAIYLSSTRLGTSRRIAIITISIGVCSGVAAIVGSWLVGKVIDQMHTGSGPLQSSIFKTVEILTQDIRSWWLGYSILLVAVGIAGVFLIRYLKKKQMPQSEVDQTKSPSMTTGS